MVWLVLLCSRTRYTSIALALPRLAAVVFGFLCLTICDHIICISLPALQNEESTRALGVPMSLGRKNGLMRRQAKAKSEYEPKHDLPHPREGQYRAENRNYQRPADDYTQKTESRECMDNTTLVPIKAELITVVKVVARGAVSGRKECCCRA